jgi:formylglycine-generating enzyme required for sulfatase activity
MEFVLIPPGTFVMGTLAGEPERESCETPHRVTLTRAFWLGVSTVTQRQWETVMGSHPSAPLQDNCPVDQVSFEQCQEFCVELSKQTGQRHRLPTEAEWEYACRAGTTTAFSFGNTISTERANCADSRKCTTPAGTFPPNSFGLYDMHGNVWEWCQDWYAGYPNREQVDPEVRKQTRNRVMRGGYWGSPPSVCRSGSRNQWGPERRGSGVGFRIVLCRD